MSYKNIDIKNYKVRLMEIREESELETEPARRDLLIKLVDWLSLKLEEWHEKLKDYEDALDELEQSHEHGNAAVNYEQKNQLMENYFNHLKEAGRLFYLYSALRIIRSEGKYWESDAPSVNAVLDHVLNLIG